MKCNAYCMALIVGVGAMFVVSASADTLDAKQIMQKVYDRDDGNHAIMDMDMTLVDKQGEQRVRSVKTFRRDAGANGKDAESIMFFQSPADVKDTGFLTYDYDDVTKDDDQWLYLPALKKIKRIASSDKSSSFMGTDFTYADMTKRNINNYQYTLVKEDTVNGDKVWVIEAVPSNEKEKEETGYSKSVLFVRQDNFVPIRGVSWLEKGGKLKYMEVKKLELVDGIWVSSEVTMTTKKEKEVLHQTSIKSRNIQFNQKQADEVFSTRKLEQGL
jgi:hypothetical protein